VIIAWWLMISMERDERWVSACRESYVGWLYIYTEAYRIADVASVALRIGCVTHLVTYLSES
jgi:hypothetical protein